MNLTTLYQANDGSAVKCASNHSGWWKTTWWGTPGSLVKLCNTIIAHPSLISHLSSPSPLQRGTHLAITITAGVQSGGIRSSPKYLQKWLIWIHKYMERDNKNIFRHWLVKHWNEMCHSVHWLHHFLKPVCNVQNILNDFIFGEPTLSHLPSVISYITQNATHWKCVWTVRHCFLSHIYKCLRLHKGVTCLANLQEVPQEV